MNNKDTIIGIVLIFAIIIGATFWMTPSKDEIKKQRDKADSIAIVSQQKRAEEIALRARELAIREAELKKQILAGKAGDSAGVKEIMLKEQLGDFAGSAIGKKESVTIGNEVLKLRISTEGGKIDPVELKNFKSWDKRPLILIDNDSLLFGLTFFSRNRIIKTDKLFFKPVFFNRNGINDSVQEVKGTDSLSFAMRYCF